MGCAPFIQTHISTGKHEASKGLWALVAGEGRQTNASVSFTDAAPAASKTLADKPLRLVI